MSIGICFSEKMKPQRVVIREHLLRGDSITGKEAIEEYDIYRLSAVILDIKTRDKIPIKSIRVQHKNKYGRGMHTRYRIPPSELKKQRGRFQFSE